MDPFITIYKKHYIPKTQAKTLPCGIRSEFKDPIAQGFRNYLTIAPEAPPAQPPTEEADHYLPKHVSQYPKHAKTHFQDPINKNIVEKSFTYSGRSMYQVDYCDLEADRQYKLEQIRKNQFTLPEGWEVPLTTQKYYYRNPTLVNPRALQRQNQIRPVNNLDPEQHIRKILKVRTGDTEYMGEIGAVGAKVIEEELHGHVVHEECKFMTEEEKAKESLISEI